MFDLNEKKFGGTVIFNNGVGGVAKDVEISVEKKKADEPDSYPNYRLVVTDNAGAKINQGFYYPKSDPNKSPEQNEQSTVREVGRVIHIARAVMGNDYQFPQVNSSKEAFDVLFKLIHDNAGGAKFNVFVGYGTRAYPDKYLKLRYFNFIEPADTNPSRLRVTPNDLLERVEQDAPSSDTGMDSLTSEPVTGKEEEWI